MAADSRTLSQQFKLRPVDLGPDNWNLLRTIVEVAPECIKVVAPDGELLQMNSAGLCLIEAPSWSAVEGASVFDLIAPEYRTSWRDNHERVCRGETLNWQFDIVGLAGTRRHMETNAVPISLSDGTVGQLAFTHDVSARRAAEQRLEQTKQALEETVTDRTQELLTARQRLQETERVFQLLIDSVSDYAIYMLDVEGRVVSWNVGAHRITGYQTDEVLGQHVSLFYTEEDRLANLPTLSLEVAARDGKVEREGWRVRKDGSRFFANVMIDAIHDKGRLVGFAKITRDITEKRDAEARLRQAQKMEVIGQFTGGAAHDFSNLLMAISGCLELVRKRVEDERTRGLVDNAAQAAKRGISLTQRMLAFARRQELKLEPVDLVGLVTGMRELLERSVGASVRIDTRFPQNLAPVRTDANQLETALLNLAINARDAMPSGGTITIAAQEVSVHPDHPTRLPPGRYTCLSFSDTGHGMDEATLARVTEPFFTTKGVGKGTGLGLAMVDGLCAQSGGKLTVRSRLYQGTTLELWMPTAGKDVQVQGPADKETVSNVTSAELRVLLVDDDPLVLRSTTAMLEDLGHLVISAPSGRAALEVLKHLETPIDVVIADQCMPGMTGLELAEAVTTVRPGVPVVIASAYAELPLGSEGTVPRLTKPYTQQQLAKAACACARLTPHGTAVPLNPGQTL